jgi:hypothetical protein
MAGRARPIDDTIAGSSEIFRSGEIQATQLGIGVEMVGKWPSSSW